MTKQRFQHGLWLMVLASTTLLPSNIPDAAAAGSILHVGLEEPHRMVVGEAWPGHHEG